MIALILLTYNAEKDLPHLMPAIMSQTLMPDTILVIDSSSSDRTRALLANYPVQIKTIAQTEFDHGGTRKLATELVDADIYIYLTQDAYPANPHAFEAIVAALRQGEHIGCAYGRQLPKENATVLSAHLRLFNYPAESHIRSFEDRDKYGFKTCFNSDSFAAYKKQALLACGNFPEHLITGEDAYVAGKMLLKGLNTAYVAEACVYHSHNLSLREEFHRYFSIGVFHGKERWLIETFNSATGEGMRYVKSEIAFLIKQGKPHLLLKSFASILIKFVAYHLGLREKYIPYNLKKRLGINKIYWRKLKSVTP